MRYIDPTGMDTIPSIIAKEYWSRFDIKNDIISLPTVTVEGKPYQEVVEKSGMSYIRNNYEFPPSDILLGEKPLVSVHPEFDIFLIGRLLTQLPKSLATGSDTKPKYINSASEARTRHIIKGDITGGGHAWFGSFNSFKNGITGEKCMFPMNWSNDKIMHAVSDVTVNNAWIQQTGRAGATITRAGAPVRYTVEGIYDGVKIRIVTTRSEIITAFPLC